MPELRSPASRHLCYSYRDSARVTWLFGVRVNMYIYMKMNVRTVMYSGTRTLVLLYVYLNNTPRPSTNFSGSV